MNNEIKPQNQASEWFNDLYYKHQDNHTNIPWAKLKVNPLLKMYLDNTKNHKGKALVIGCGLGDDASALELAGYDVLAIDVSQVALELAQKRFNNTKVIFKQQDIFDMPNIYNEYFDFVFEAYTIQSLPIKFRDELIKSISNTVKVNGKLLVLAHKRKLTLPGPPWPLSKDEIDLFKKNLTEVDFKIYPNKKIFALEEFSILYRK